MQPSDRTTTTRDPGFVAIVVLIVITAVWLLLTPWVSFIARTTMRRFHLQSESFVNFAIQFPIPAMYNFANTVKINNIPPGLVDPLFSDPLFADPEGPSQARFVNHFPARRITFSDARYDYLQANQDCWFEIRSGYRGQNLISKLHLEPIETGGFEMHRESSGFKTRSQVDP